ncbi:unnamed protein product [Urochloa humidicola]
MVLPVFPNQCEHGVPPRKQVGRSALYEVVLEQRKVLLGGSVETELEAGSSSRHGDAYVWFVAATGERVGVCTTVWERVLWEQTRGGWVDEEASVVDGLVLVERFVVKEWIRVWLWPSTSCITTR